MKLTDRFIKDEIKTVSQKEIEKKSVFIGSQNIHPGQRCFEISTITGDIYQWLFKTGTHPRRLRVYHCTQQRKRFKEI